MARMYALNPEQIRSKYNLPMLREVENFVAEIVGVDVPFNNYITGYTAFTHKAGIHAKAILNNPETYEILDPADFGLTRYLHIAHRLTGWNAVKQRAEQLQLDLTDPQVKEVTAHIKTEADQRKLSLDDVDVLAARVSQPRRDGNDSSCVGGPTDEPKSTVPMQTGAAGGCTRGPQPQTFAQKALARAAGLEERRSWRGRGRAPRHRVEP